MNEKQAWHTGLLVGALLKAGVSAAPRIDTKGDYTEEVEVVISFPSTLGGQTKEKILVRVMPSE